MRIGIEATALHGPRSGVGTYTANLLEHLWSGPSGREHEWLLFSNRRLSVNGAAPAGRTHVVDSYRFRYQSIWRQMFLPLALRAHGPVVCHFTNLTTPLWAPCPMVVTIHDLTLRLLPEYHPPQRRAVMSPLLGPAARQATRIIAVSETSKRDIVRLLGAPEEKVSVIYEAAGPAFRRRPEAEVAEVLRRHSLRRPYILYVGTIEPRKNLVRLVRAYARLRASGRREMLVLVGALGWGYEPLFAEIERLGIGDSIVHLGFVPQEELVALYNGAALFVFPSLYEGFGLPPLEAMACGTPVITSSTSACAELAGDAAVLVDPSDETALADAMGRVLGDATLREELSARGLIHAGKFSWQLTAAQTMKVYSEVAGLHSNSNGSVDPRPIQVTNDG
ncbi:MAG TPA: glycosyltransferase family 1 protein [Ardenticatenaceae bacterium]|nr:glycosyltransferase family 1 protein [Ardenticatenaceae bacterium]